MMGNVVTLRPSLKFRLTLDVFSFCREHGAIPTILYARTATASGDDEWAAAMRLIADLTREVRAYRQQGNFIANLESGNL